MSNGIPQRRTRPGFKPQKYTNWPAILGVLGLLLLVACGLLVNHFTAKPLKTDSPTADPVGDGPAANSRRLAVPRIVFNARPRSLQAASVLEQPPSRLPGASADAAAAVVVVEQVEPLGEPITLWPPASPASRTEEELIALLGIFQPEPQQRRFVDVDLDAVTGTTDKLRKAIQAGEIRGVDGWLGFAEQRPDLQGLPFRKGKDCQLDKKATTAMANISGHARRATRKLAVRKRDLEFQYGSFVEKARDEDANDFADLVIEGGAKLPDDAVPGVVQILQAERAVARAAMVEFLAGIDGPNATAALAQSALFEFSKDVRSAAIAYLNSRPAKDYRPRLLDGFRYPWPPVAEHAALALVAVDDEGAVDDLVELLDEPDPGEPFPLPGEGNKWGVRELVRINHLRNCMLCHAPSIDRDDPIRGFVPHPSAPVIRYYESRSGDFVRADVTYLKQDFSITQPVPSPGKWPAEQRFDFLVRTRELTAAELADLVPSLAQRVERSSRESTYLQREAVLYALRKLTGLDAGRSSEKWREMLGKYKRGP